MRIVPITNKEEALAALKAGDRPAWYLKRVASAYGLDVSGIQDAHGPNFRRQYVEEMSSTSEIADVLENYSSGEIELDEVENLVASIVARNYHEGETIADLRESFDASVGIFLESGRVTDDEYHSLTAAVQRTVRTPEGQKRFGDPINSPIKANEQLGRGEKTRQPVARLDINEVPIKKQTSTETQPPLENKAGVSETREQFNEVLKKRPKLSLDEVASRLEQADPVTQQGFSRLESAPDDTRPPSIRDEFMRAIKNNRED